METSQLALYNDITFKQEFPDATDHIKSKRVPMRPVSMVLDELGKIIVCNELAEQLFDFARGELLYRHVCQIFPQLSESEFMKDGHVHARFTFLSHCEFPFKAKTNSGRYFECRLNFAEFVTHGNIRTLNLLVFPHPRRST